MTRRKPLRNDWNTSLTEYSVSLFQWYTCFCVSFFWLSGAGLVVDSPLADLIVQDHRFNISENYGCTAASFPANQTLALLLFPPTLLGLVAFFRCSKYILPSAWSSLTSYFQLRPSINSLEDFMPLTHTLQPTLCHLSLTSLVVCRLWWFLEGYQCSSPRLLSLSALQSYLGPPWKRFTKTLPSLQ